MTLKWKQIINYDVDYEKVLFKETLKSGWNFKLNKAL